MRQRGRESGSGWKCGEKRLKQRARGWLVVGGMRTLQKIENRDKTKGKEKDVEESKRERKRQRERKR